MGIETQQLQQILEGALMAAGQPLNTDRLLSLFVNEDEPPSKEAVLEALNNIADSCEGRGFELRELASGWRFQVRKETAPWVNLMWEEKPQKYSRALLETLALIAYRQPITRGDIEEIRGVAVSSHIIKTLSEREWIKVVGHRDVPGRPSLYATTRQFLDYFNLKSLEELPSLGELQDLDNLNPELDLNDDEAANVPDSDQSEAQIGPLFDTELPQELQQVSQETSGQATEEEPSAGEEPSASEEPSANEEPSADSAPVFALVPDEQAEEDSALPEIEESNETELEPKERDEPGSEEDEPNQESGLKKDDKGSLFPASSVASVFDEH
jgi:segregation and condensation protein B